MKTITDTLNLAPQGKNFLTADWPAPTNIKTLITTRNGGVSEGVYRSLNVGSHVGDNLEAVLRNREIVQEQVGLPVAYLNQIHSTIVVNAVEALGNTPDADASVDTTGTVACASMTADCLPVLFCDKAGTVVAAAHAGWRGLAGGVLQNTIAAMNVEPLEIMAYLAPAIGLMRLRWDKMYLMHFAHPCLKLSLRLKTSAAANTFADIYALAHMVLHREGVNMIYGGTHCTVLERDTFFSYRRDGQTGRMVSLIWLEK